MKIDSINAFLTEFKKSIVFGTVNFPFNEIDFHFVIPEEMRHQILIRSLSKNEIVPQVNDFYTDYHKIYNYAFNPVQKLERYSDPFAVHIHGVPYLSGFLYKLLVTLGDNNPRRISLDNESERFNLLMSYFDNYGKGFAEGFELFEVINFNVLQNEAERKRKVYRTATHHWKRIYGPSIDRLNNTLADPFETGKLYGIIYKSWSYILGNQYSFKEFFEEKNQIIPEVRNNEKKLEKTKSKPRRDRLTKGFLWLAMDSTTTEENLNTIHSKLFAEGLINCGLVAFKKIFRNNSNFQQIEWLGTTPDLINFRAMLVENKMIAESNHKWVQLASCFKVDTKRENFTNLLNQYPIDGTGQKCSKYFFLLELMNSIR